MFYNLLYPLADLFTPFNLFRYLTFRSIAAFLTALVLSFLIGAQPEAAVKARDRFALALRYAERRPVPRLVITTGVIGSGKSTVARELAARHGAIVVRTDAVRKRLAGRAVTERTPAAFGEGLYGPDMGRRTYEAAMTLARRLLSAYRKQLDLLASALLSRETLNEQEILEVTGLPPAPALDNGVLPAPGAPVPSATMKRGPS